MKMKNHMDGSPQVRHEVHAENLREPRLVDPGRKSPKPKKDTNVRENDLAELVGRKHHGVGVEVWGGRSKPHITISRDHYSTND